MQGHLGFHQLLQQAGEIHGLGVGQPHGTLLHGHRWGLGIGADRNEMVAHKTINALAGHTLGPNQPSVGLKHFHPNPNAGIGLHLQPHHLAHRQARDAHIKTGSQTRSRWSHQLHLLGALAPVLFAAETNNHGQGEKTREP